MGRDAPASWQLVFVPISIWLETHRLDIFYEALAAGMAEILGEELPPTHTDKGIYYADHRRTLASAAVAKGRRILIVLDGIDEALGERFDARWFPATRGPSCDSCFRPAGRLAIWALRAGKHGLDGSGTRVQSRELPVLAREGVRDLLSKMGAPTDVLASRPDLVDRLHAVAEGEPLVLRYYAEDIWSRGRRCGSPSMTWADATRLERVFRAVARGPGAPLGRDRQPG